MPGRRRPKDGVPWHAYVPGIHVFATLQLSKAWLASAVGFTDCRKVASSKSGIPDLQ
jgi:hypothetical protein